MIEIKANLGEVKVSLYGESEIVCAEYISAVNCGYRSIIGSDTRTKRALKKLFIREVLTGSIFKDHEDHV